MSEKTDSVNHPAHYTQHAAAECIQIIENMSLCRGSAIKYLWRAGEKDPTKTVEDLRKAAWFVDREIQRLTGQPAAQRAPKAPKAQKSVAAPKDAPAGGVAPKRRGRPPGSKNKPATPSDVTATPRTWVLGAETPSDVTAV